MRSRQEVEDIQQVGRSDLGDMYDRSREYVSRRDPQSYEALRIQLEVAQFKIPNLISVLPTGFKYEHVIEVGCATGDLLAAFPPRLEIQSLRKVGFDVSILNIRTARERYSNIEFLDSDFNDYDGRADIVILSDVLEHLPNDLGLLQRAGKVATVVLVNLPLEDTWINRRREYGLNDSSGHLRAYSLSQGLALMERAGLKIVSWKRVWSHETDYDVHRRRLRARYLGHAYSGNFAWRLGKSAIHSVARAVLPFGRRLYPSNLFVSAIPGK
jgi:SAM-dependent methyltransferase